MESEASHPSQYWIVNKFGIHRAFDVFWRFGGQRIYLRTGHGRNGKRNRQRHLTDGEAEVFDALEIEFSGLVKVPLARAFTANYMWWIRGMSGDMIASALRVDYATVGRLIRRGTPPTKMAPLALPAPGGTRGLAKKRAAEGNQIDKIGDLKSAPDQSRQFGHLVASTVEGADHDA